MKSSSGSVQMNEVLTMSGDRAHFRDRYSARSSLAWRSLSSHVDDGHRSLPCERTFADISSGTDRSDQKMILIDMDFTYRAARWRRSYGPVKINEPEHSSGSMIHGRRKSPTPHYRLLGSVGLLGNKLNCVRVPLPARHQPIG